MNQRTETLLFTAVGFAFAVVAAIGIFQLGWPAYLAFLLPVFGGLVFLAVFGSFRDGVAARLVDSLRQGRGS